MYGAGCTNLDHLLRLVQLQIEDRTAEARSRRLSRSVRADSTARRRRLADALGH